MAKSNDNFSLFGDEKYQSTLIKALIGDPSFTEQVLDILDEEYFTNIGHKRIFSFIKDQIEEKSIFPSIDVISYWIEEEEDEDIIKKSFEEVKDSPDTDLIYVKEKTIEFCKNQAMKNAIIRSADLLEMGDFDAIYKTIEVAMLAGRSNEIGHNYFEDTAKRNQKVYRKPISTGLGEPLDKLLGGGISAGELGCILAPTGIGKSMALVGIAYGAISQGLNAVYYTLELSESQVGVRMDARVCNMSISEAYKNPNRVSVKLAKNRANFGNLIIKQFPTKKASITTIKAHLSKLRTAKFSPDVVIIDYADLMRSLKNYKEKRHELESIYEDIRGLAVEMGVPVWTASQSNRASMDQEVVSISHISESYGKATVADFIISIQRTIADKKNNRARIFVAKNRAGRDGVIMEAVMDTASAYIEALTEQDGEWYTDEKAMEFQNNLERQSEKSNLRNKLKSIGLED